MEVVPWRAGEAQMRDNPERGELDPADGVRTPQALQEEFSLVAFYPA